MEKNFWANKPRHKAIALVLLVCMLMTLVPAMAWAETTPKTVNDDAELLQAVTSSSSIQLGADITTDAALTIASGVTVDLDLNGHKLKLTTPSVLTVEGALTITDTSDPVSGSFVGTTPTVTGKLVITGGIFNFNPTGYVPMTGYHVAENTTDGTWTVTKSEKIEVPVGTIVISGDQQIKAGDSQGVTLTATLTPDNATTGTALKWSSNDPNVNVTAEDVTDSFHQTAKVVANANAAVGDKVIITVSNGTKQDTYELTIVKGNPADITVTNIHLNKTSLNLDADATATLTASFTPADANVGTDLTWESSAPAIVSVTGSNDTHSATVKALEPGTATITVKNTDGINATCTVTVAERPVTEIKLSSEQLNLLTNDTGNLTATLLLANATTGTTLTWESDNTAVVTVTPATDTHSADYAAVGVGNATITVKSGSISATCAVVVTDTEIFVNEITLDQMALALDLNGKTTGSIKATVAPADANKDAALTWTSSNPSVAAVAPANTTGTSEVTVTAVGVGETTITVSNGKITKECVVTVTDTKTEVTNIILNKLVDEQRPEDVTNTEQALAVGAILGLNAGLTGSNLSLVEVTWTSLNKSVADVDENGAVTAKSSGTATITATVDGRYTQDGQPLTASCDVKVTAVVIPPALQREPIAQELADNKATEATVEATNSDIFNAIEITNPNTKVYLDTQLASIESDADGSNTVITYQIKPMKVETEGEGGEATTTTSVIDNTKLNGAITFRLPVPDSITEKYVKIQHTISDTGRVEYLYAEIQTEGGHKFVEVTVYKFSDFVVSFANELPAEAPEATPNKGTGTYVGTQVITLAIPDGAQVYYTVNGSEPTVANAFLYETAKPIEIKTTTTLKVLVVHPDYLDGIYEYTYTITNGGDDGIIDGGDSGSGGSSGGGGGGGGGSTGGGGGTVVTPNNNSWDNPYFDVSSTAWYYNAVKYAVEKGLFSGVTDTQFGPNVSMTRGMLVTVLYKLEGRPAAGGNSFIDVSSNAYYSNAVAWAASKNIVSGIGDGMFAPGQAISREQMVVILYKYAQNKGMDTSASASLSNFADYDKVSPWAREAMQWAVGAGLISGKNGSILDPTGTATRAEVASILMNFLED